MKKKLLSAFLTLLVTVSVTACSSAPSSETSSVLPTPQSEISMAKESTASSAPATDTSEEEALISELMENEFGETEPITITAVEEPHEIEGTDSSLYYVDFSTNSRKLFAVLTVNSKGEKSVTAISKADDKLHYYYYKNASEIIEMGLTTIHVYDYKTDEEIDLKAEISSQNSNALSQVNDILSDLPDLEIDSKETTDSLLVLNVAIDYPYSDEPEICAEWFFYYSMEFIAEYLNLDSYPYGNVIFQIIVDGQNIGFMNFFAVPEVGLIGTSTPVIFDDNTSDIFQEKYDAMMSDVDSKNFMS